MYIQTTFSYEGNRPARYGKITDKDSTYTYVLIFNDDRLYALKHYEYTVVDITPEIIQEEALWKMKRSG